MSIVFVVGTRPEVIKVAPVVLELRALGVSPLVVFTGQHTDLLDGSPEKDLGATHTLGIAATGEIHGWIQKAGVELGHLLNELRPSLVVVQGDTMSAVVGGLSASIRRCPLAHIEAGIRSGRLDEPWPEESFRKKLTRWSDYHFAPTQLAAANLIGEGIAKEAIFVTGNPVVSALERYSGAKPVSEPENRVLITMHRREWLSKGKVPVDLTIRAFAEACADLPTTNFVWPVHPHVEKVTEIRSKSLPKNLKLVSPMGYRELTHCLASSIGVATDSGGIQEEAATLGVPCAVLRNVTDRPESLAVGVARLYPPDTEGIAEAIKALADRVLPRKPSYVYGTPDSAKRIAELIKQFGVSSVPQVT